MLQNMRESEDRNISIITLGNLSNFWMCSNTSRANQQANDAEALRATPRAHQGGNPMHKYAALTALAIALITMLALNVSASLTPANARGVCRCAQEMPRPASCQCGCAWDAIRRHAPLLTMFDDKKYQACLSNWVNWFEATRDRRLGHPQ
jgi:hypothetical protein